MSAARDRATVERAFLHHELQGTIAHVSSPERGYPRWRVRFTGEAMVHSWTTPQALAAAAALDATERQRAAPVD